MCAETGGVVRVARATLALTSRMDGTAAFLIAGSTSVPCYQSRAVTSPAGACEPLSGALSPGVMPEGLSAVRTAGSTSRVSVVHT